MIEVSLFQYFNHNLEIFKLRSISIRFSQAYIKFQLIRNEFNITSSKVRMHVIPKLIDWIPKFNLGLKWFLESLYGIKTGH